MSTSFQAVYENGVLRPLTPLSLDERAIVDVVVSPRREVELSEDDISDRRAMWQEFFRAVDEIDEPLPDDSLTNQDIDDILYGSSDAVR